MELFTFKVRQNWQEYDREIAREDARRWWRSQVIILISTLAMFLISLLHLPAPWESVFENALSYSFFLMFSLWTIYRTNANFLKIILSFYGWLLVCALLAGFTVLQPSGVEAGVFSSIWPYPLIFIVPLISWAILGRSYQEFPEKVKRLGLIPDRWPLNLLVGIISGGSIGFHFLLVLYLIYGSGQFLAGLPIILWTFIYRLGFAALGEELLLRGLCFQMLYEESHSNIWKAALQIAFLNLLIYLVPILQTPNPMDRLLIGVYEVAFSFLAIFLRYRKGGLVTSIACNIVFHTMMAMILVW